MLEVANYIVQTFHLLPSLKDLIENLVPIVTQLEDISVKIYKSGYLKSSLRESLSKYFNKYTYETVRYFKSNVVRDSKSFTLLISVLV
jgi:hypothetical protein